MSVSKKKDQRDADKGSEGHRTQSDVSSPSMESLARQLIDRTRTVESESRSPGDVILDIEADDVRLVLMARPLSHPIGVATLSPREQEIARMVARGYPNKTIAALLKISSFTVSTHLRRVFAKLGVQTRAAMVATTMQAGLLGHDGEETTDIHSFLVNRDERRPP